MVMCQFYVFCQFIHLFVCLFVAKELSQTVATSRRDLLSAIVFVAEHPINHNFPFMINQTQSITIFYRSPFYGVTVHI